MQLGSWSVDSEGQLYEITVTRGENGKDVVRVNGRVAAKPITSAESEIELVVGGQTIVLYRQGPDKFNLQEGVFSAATATKSPAALARELAARDDKLNAMTVLAEGNAPLAMRADPFFKRLPMLGWVVIIAMVAGMMFYMAKGKSYQEVATERVTRLLTELHQSKGSTVAIKLWYNNKRYVEMSELTRASDNFDRWRQQKDLYRQIGTFAIIDCQVIEGTSVPTAYVRFTVGENQYRVKVTQDLPIAWAD